MFPSVGITELIIILVAVALVMIFVRARDTRGKS